jgi:hypothetical protein
VMINHPFSQFEQLLPKPACSGASGDLRQGGKSG